MLKSCPFCGGEATLFERHGEDVWDIGCATDGCYLEGGAEWCFPSDEKWHVVEMWNTRSEASPKASRYDAIERRFRELRDSDILNNNQKPYLLWQSVQAIVGPEK